MRENTRKVLLMRTSDRIFKRYGYCPFCLSIQHTASHVRAEFAYNIPIDASPDILTDPPKLAAWLDKMQKMDNFTMFILNATSAAFIPIAIIANTPLCVYHLWQETDPAKGRLNLR